MASADSSQFVVTTADETACETSTLKVRTLSPHLSATSTRTSGNFWTSSLLADLSVFPSLICDFCPSDQGFAYSFLQIPPHDGHPCCSAIHFLVAQACSGLSPVRARPWRANQKSPLQSKIARDVSSPQDSTKRGSTLIAALRRAAATHFADNGSFRAVLKPLRDGLRHASRQTACSAGLPGGSL